MRLVHRTPMWVLMPLVLVMGVLPALALDLRGIESNVAHSLVLSWVLLLSALCGNEFSRRRKAWAASHVPDGEGSTLAS